MSCAILECKYFPVLEYFYIYCRAVFCSVRCRLCVLVGFIFLFLVISYWFLLFCVLWGSYLYFVVVAANTNVTASGEFPAFAYINALDFFCLMVLLCFLLFVFYAFVLFLLDLLCVFVISASVLFFSQ